MKLDTRHLRYLSQEDWRVLTAVEMGSKNHEVVPTSLIIQLANLRGGSGVHRCISTLAKANLIARMQNIKYDGYRLTYGGLDYLALHTHMKRSTLYSTGPCVGVGKESDIYVCAQPLASSETASRSRINVKAPSQSRKLQISDQNPACSSDEAVQVVLKIHRLGRISFRSIKNNRDYLRNRTSASWMYMSRLAAQKEFAFMQILAANGFSVPEPIAWSRHTVVMSLIQGEPLRAVKEVGNPARLHADLMAIIVRFAHHGLIHGDFNEFNIMIQEDFSRNDSNDSAAAATRGRTSSKKAALDIANKPPDAAQSAKHFCHSDSSAPQMAGFTPNGLSADLPTSSSFPEMTAACDKTYSKIKVVVIDFPQLLSTSHPNAEFYFNRDVECIKTFFRRRFHFISSEPGPFFAESVAEARVKHFPRLDVDVEASGFSKKMAKELQTYIEHLDVDQNREHENDNDNDDSFEDNEDDDDDDDEHDDDDDGDGEDDIAGAANDDIVAFEALKLNEMSLEQNLESSSIKPISANS